MDTGKLVSRLLVGMLLPCAAASCGGSDLTLPGSGSPADLLAFSGDRQEAEAGATLPDPIVVQALDEGGRPVPDAEVAFRFDGDVGGSVSPASARTNSEGKAEATVRLGSAAGAQLVDANVVGGPADAVATFRLTAVPRDEGGDGGDGDGGDNGGPGGGGGGGDDDDDEDWDDD